MIRLAFIFLSALALTIMPLPEILAAFRPPWVLLVILYVQFYLPHYFKISGVFILGLILDTLLSTVMGEHTLSLCLVCWVASTQTRCFPLFKMSQQMIFIGLFAFGDQLINMLVDAFFGYQPQWMAIPMAGMVSVLVWPWLRLLGEEFLVKRSNSRQIRP